MRPERGLSRILHCLQWYKLVLRVLVYSLQCSIVHTPNQKPRKQSLSAMHGALLARDAQAKLALIVAQCLSIHLSVCLSATA